MIEVEIKVLLGEKANADKFRAKLPEPIKHSKQLNHYFLIKNKDKFRAVLSPLIKDHSAFAKILTSDDISVRTREMNERVILVMKASIETSASSKSNSSDSTSANGRSRLELEQDMSYSMKALDELLLSAGCEYQAKWSREREEFDYKGVAITLDKNAGYGYLSEFEIQVETHEEAEKAKKKIYKLIKEFGLEELDSARLQRMFDYYNKNWKEFYGTDKTFTLQ